MSAAGILQTIWSFNVPCDPGVKTPVVNPGILALNSNQQSEPEERFEVIQAPARGNGIRETISFAAMITTAATQSLQDPLQILPVMCDCVFGGKCQAHRCTLPSSKNSRTRSHIMQSNPKIFWARAWQHPCLRCLMLLSFALSIDRTGPNHTMAPQFLPNGVHIHLEDHPRW